MEVASIEVALPLASAEMVAALRGAVDGLLCLSDASGSGSLYARFEDTTDQKAVRILRNARHLDRMLH
jgi:putative phosphoribosyl transferase